MARVLVVLGGLPGTGKSTVAAELQQRATFGYVRIDSIENALRLSGEPPLPRPATSGYVVAYAVVRDLLRSNCRVVVECVNPIEITRRAWRDVATDCGADILEIELYCSDVTEHRYRVENRQNDLLGLELPRWDAVRARDYEPWPEAHVHIDTATHSPASAADTIATVMSGEF